jgi:capsular polysaccharide biosynthesis protein
MKSVSPNRLLNVVLAPVLGLVVGVAAAFLQEFFAPSLKT